tara:strand:- start:254 stop:622 length:369 start_codon:yes stop_codon:yes gene_type:complete
MARRTKKPIYLDEITEQTLRLQKKTLDRLEQWSAKLDDDPEEFDASFARELANVTRALGVVLKEARAINKEAAAAAMKLSPTEKQKLLVEYFEKQPFEVQRNLLWQMQQICNQTRVVVKKES